MHSNQSDVVAHAQIELNQYLGQQASVIAPELTPLVPAPIKVERVGFTRNASNTPYIVYWVANRRCCTFVKRRWFLNMVQALLKLKCSIEDKICGINLSPYFGLSVKAGDRQEYIPSAYVRKFFDRYNQVAIEKISPQQHCDCNDLFDMCPHAIALAFKPCL